MQKTAGNLTRQEWQTYQPDRNFNLLQHKNKTQINKRWKNAWSLAHTAAQLLKQKFKAKKVVIFGSLLNKSSFTQWSDIDIAAWGIPDSVFYSAVAAVTGLSPSFKIDMVDIDNCKPVLYEAIIKEGIEL